MTITQNKITVLLALLTPEMLTLEEEVNKLATKCEEQGSEINYLREMKEELRAHNDRLYVELGELRRVAQDVRDTSYWKTRAQEAEKQLLKGAHEAYMTNPKVEAYMKKITPEVCFALTTGAVWNKIEHIKNLRECGIQGLKECKDFVEMFDYIGFARKLNEQPDSSRALLHDNVS